MRSYKKWEIDSFKKDINLVSVMLTFGFKHSKGSTRNSPKLVNRSTGERYIITKKSGFFSYYSYNSAFDPSKPLPTIIDFLLSRPQGTIDNKMSISFGQALEYCDKIKNDIPFFINDIKNSSFSSKVDPINDIDSSRGEKIYSDIANRLVNVFDYKFFSSRGISKKTIDDQRINFMFSQYIYKNPATLKSYINTASKFFSNSKLQSISVLNIPNKPKFNPCGDALGYSKPNHNFSDKLDLLSIFENSIDAASYKELNNLYENYQLIYTGGSHSPNQVKLISDFINFSNPSKIHFCQDNDPSGQMLKTGMLLNLDIDKYINANYKDFSLDENILARASGSAYILRKDDVFNRHIACLNIKFNDDNKNSLIDSLNILNQEISNLNIQYNNFAKSPLPDDFKFKLDVVNLNDNSCEVNISFLHDKQRWSNMFDFIHELKYKSLDFLVNDNSLLKDFNDDLKAAKGLHPKFKILTDNDNNFFYLNKSNNKVSEFDNSKPSYCADLFEKINDLHVFNQYDNDNLTSPVNDKNKGVSF
jgi:hypothetical protein